ncbi:hypothetical protein CRG98_014498 [Punica granatum]|uniref:Uncharacterized protein n=1 Tax=Punica granatum TaxID=22663 RepID=A0A2I0K914_PUNGR|nr:hypothetical protein CRG98_014498 [Punica granatum]
MSESTEQTPQILSSTGCDHTSTNAPDPIRTQTVQDYLQSVKAIADELALAGAPITSDDVTIHVLNNIGPEFKELAAAIRAREQPIEFEELYDKWTDYELFLQRESSHTNGQLITANLSQKKGGANDKFRKNQ